MCNERGRYLSQINSISRSSDFYHDPFDNWCFYERLWMTEISHLRERNLVSASSYGSPRSNFFAVKEEFQQPYNCGKLKSFKIILFLQIKRSGYNDRSSLAAVSQTVRIWKHVRIADGLQSSFSKELITPFGPKLSNYLKSAALLKVSSSENLSVMKPLNKRDTTKIGVNRLRNVLTHHVTSVLLSSGAHKCIYNPRKIIEKLGSLQSSSELCIVLFENHIQSVDLDDHHKPEFRRVFSSSIIENGHQSSSVLEKVSHELFSVHMSDSSPEAHAPAVTLQMPHLPVTAVTRVSEKFSGETTCSTGTTNTSAGLLGQSKSKNVMAVKTSNQSVKAWNSSTVRTVGSSATGENTTSVTKSVSTVSYGTSSGTKTSESATDSYCDVTPSSLPTSSPTTVHRQVERRRELVRSQTLPRTTGTQARKALLEKSEHSGGKGKGESRVKLKRSQSFAVASPSSIKQILLDWCRSKTIGYKHIDLQNFSSSWNDGMAFCALVPSFFPEAFDYNKLDPANGKRNFELAFTMAEKVAHCDRLIEVDDMMMMGHKPDPMCVFTYVQSLYNHL
ncbi:LOW QUALITY PROTEIN: smoothelin-like protein 2 [Strix aluco]|uniref:LOW QUALITY PROTEIN: smoothelin-like protein 2 n=1 Tax=Strix aluco TaxID=111821 RepID=UPI003DA4D2BA